MDDGSGGKVKNFIYDIQIYVKRYILKEVLSAFII